ncbi:MAG: curved DNA-binding protein [Myxococcota bacterium]|jgi:curved DNA-binding protein
MATTDYYALLEVSRDATADEIKKAFRKIAMKYHPDRNDTPEAEDRFKEANEAYAVLSDPEKRKQYDTYGAEGFGQRYTQDDIFSNVDLGSLFEEMGVGGRGRGGRSFDFSSMFGRGGGGQRRGASPFGQGGQGAGPTRGRDIETEITISFHEAYHGAERNLDVSGPGGPESLTVRIPRGVKSGQKLRLRGKGHPGSGGGPRGDIRLKIQVAAHPSFRLRGDKLEMDARVPLSLLVLGGAIDIETPDGETQRLKVPAGTNANTKIRLRGHGFPGKGGDLGDLFVKLTAPTPAELTDDQRSHFEALRDSGL